jgi:hypothetical protein
VDGERIPDPDAGHVHEFVNTEHLDFVGLCNIPSFQAIQKIEFHYSNFGTNKNLYRINMSA